MLPDPIAEAVRSAEADILAFEARREVIPAYRPGDRVEFYGEEFEVSSYPRGDAPGGALLAGVDLEGVATCPRGIAGIG